MGVARVEVALAVHVRLAHGVAAHAAHALMVAWPVLDDALLSPWAQPVCPPLIL